MAEVDGFHDFGVVRWCVWLCAPTYSRIYGQRPCRNNNVDSVSALDRIFMELTGGDHGCLTTCSRPGHQQADTW